MNNRGKEILDEFLKEDSAYSLRYSFNGDIVRDKDLFKDYLRELEQRIDKAIEYIKQYGNLYCLKHKQFKDYHQYKVLLDILQGSDKE